MYHEGNRRLQDLFDSRRIADRLVEVTHRTALTEDDRAFIESRTMFFLATADADGRPDCSYKGGAPGFVRVTSPDSLVFPSYDGNGMWKSAGNVVVNPAVGLLFIDFERPRRLRVNGEAKLFLDGPLVESFHGAQVVVEVSVRDVFPNCPRYVHGMQGGEPSPHVPRPGHEPPVPAWKRDEAFRNHLPKRG